jgi:hypothetical protein
MALAYDSHDFGDDWGVIEHSGHGSWRFFRMNPVRDLLKSGKTVVGTAGSLSEDNMAMLADSGLDFILFDSQHAPVEVKQYQRSIQAMRGKQAAPIVRSSSGDFSSASFSRPSNAAAVPLPLRADRVIAEGLPQPGGAPHRTKLEAPKKRRTRGNRRDLHA